MMTRSLPRQLDVLGAGDPIGDVSFLPSAHGLELFVCSGDGEHEGRCLYAPEDRPHVDRVVHVFERGRGPGGCTVSHGLREPFDVLGIVRQRGSFTRHPFLRQLDRSPSSRYILPFRQVVLLLHPERVVGGPCGACAGRLEDQRLNPFGMGRREERRQGRAVRCAEHHHPLGADRVQHRPHVVDALLEVGGLGPIRQPGPALVEHDQPGESGELRVEERVVLGTVVLNLEVRGEPSDPEDIDRSLPPHLVGDVDPILGQRIPRAVGLHDQPTTRYRCQRSGTPFSSCSPASSKTRPEPATRSFTVWETNTSDDPASAPTRAPMCTAMP